MLKYAITDPKYYPDLKQSIRTYKSLLEADLILFRDKLSSVYELKAREFMGLKAEFKAKFIIHNDINLALNLGADGVHFSSDNINALANCPKNLLKITSTHDTTQIEKAFMLNTDFISISPIFASPNKGEPLGVQKALELVGEFRHKAFGLGGIVSTKEINDIKNAGFAGFASIRYFAN